MLVVLLFLSLGTPTAGKWYIVALRVAYYRRELQDFVPAHYSTEVDPESVQSNMQQCHYFLDFRGQPNCRLQDTLQQ